MTKELRGLCLIINMETFDNPRKYEERTGSSVDAGNLKDLATELGFEVECEF